ncbi:helix-turn-helix domain-containing protein [Pseudomonas cichorii]|uniref:helix-turn-helix domain-containing protein n=1 Tax=Pseudomonas cichorii TaxID=36746 RepID=UPI001910E28E
MTPQTYTARFSSPATQRPGLTQTEAARELGLPRSTVQRHSSRPLTTIYDLTHVLRTPLNL